MKIYCDHSQSENNSIEISLHIGAKAAYMIKELIARELIITSEPYGTIEHPKDKQLRQYRNDAFFIIHKQLSHVLELTNTNHPHRLE